MSERPTKLWNSKFVYLLATFTFMMVGNYIARPIVSNYAIALGAAMSIAGFITGLNFAVAVLLRPVTGYLSDRIDKKTSLIIAAAAFTLSSAGCAVTTSVPLIGFFCAIQGFAFSFQSVGLVALVTLCVPQKNLGSGIGWTGVISTVSMAVGPSIADIASSALGYPLTFALGAVVSGVGCLMAFAYKSPVSSRGIGFARSDDDTDRGFSWAGTLKQAFYGPAVPMTIVGLLAICSHATMATMLLTVQEGGYVQNAPLYFIAYAVVALVSRPLSGHLFDRVGSRAIGVPVLVIGTLGMALLIFSGETWAIIASGVLMGLGQASAISVTQAQAVATADASHVGRATNTYYLGMDLGAAIGPFICGPLLQFIGPQAFFAFNALTLAVGAILFLIFRSPAPQKIV